MKKKVLYISNIEVPYRTLFFNELAKKCDLTVLYERSNSSNRNKKWATSQSANFKVHFLDGINIKNEYSFSLKINKYLFGDYDIIIFGCYNSPIQMYGTTLFRLLKKDFFINLDGEYFLDDKNIKGKIKRFFIKGASGYFIAGETNVTKLKKIVKNENVFPYHFSSLTKKELSENAKEYLNNNQGDFILVIGQYFEYKGLDIALDVAQKLPNYHFKFVGMNKRAGLFKDLINKKGVKNVEVIPFMSREDLNNAYKSCKLLLLTSRRECWGLVINEAASFGCPILATQYAGAAIEFLTDEYKDYLIDPHNINEIVTKIHNNKFDAKYKTYLIQKSQNYNIENNAKTFSERINGVK